MINLHLLENIPVELLNHVDFDTSISNAERAIELELENQDDVEFERHPDDCSNVREVTWDFSDPAEFIAHSEEFADFYAPYYPEKDFWPFFFEQITNEQIDAITTFICSNAVDNMGGEFNYDDSYEYTIQQDVSEALEEYRQQWNEWGKQKEEQEREYWASR
jgi:hypothetical protein